MDNYSINEALFGLNDYVFYMVNLKHNLLSNTYYRDYKYIEGDLANKLLSYESVAILELEKLLSKLQKITISEITDAVSVMDFTFSTWGDEVYPIEKEQQARELQIQAILEGKQTTEQFISQTITLLKNMFEPTYIEPLRDDLQLKIDRVFGDWKDFGYMSEADYIRFKEHIYQFIQTGQIPNISPKFDIPQKKSRKLHKGMLYYLFHRLYMVCDQNIKLDLFSELFKALFNGFEDRSIKDLSSDLSNYAHYIDRLNKFSY